MDPALKRLGSLLAPLTNHEKTRPAGTVWTLDGVRQLLGAAGAPLSTRPAVQVVGSKGKGTACSYLAAAAQAAGRRPGLYTSPHQRTVLERVQVGGRMVDAEVLEHGLRRVLARARDLEVPLTFFEAMTLAAVECFEAEGATLAVWEAGLGGRLDATTALPVDATVVTEVEVEHAALLGTTVAAVAAEKAWAMRAGGVAFATATGAALEVLAAHAAEHQVRLFRFGAEYGAEDVHWDGEAWNLKVRPLTGAMFPLRLVGAAQVEVALATTAAAVVTWLLHPAELSFGRPPLPGRFEVVALGGGRKAAARAAAGTAEPVVVMDGAHTPGSLAALAAEYRRRWPETHCSLLFASAADKRWQDGLSALLPVVDRAWVTGLEGVPFLEPAVAADWLRQRGVAVETVSTAAAGLERMRAHGTNGLVTGSFYLVGAVRQHLELP